MNTLPKGLHGLLIMNIETLLQMKEGSGRKKSGRIGITVLYLQDITR